MARGKRAPEDGSAGFWGHRHPRQRKQQTVSKSGRPEGRREGEIWKAVVGLVQWRFWEAPGGILGDSRCRAENVSEEGKWMCRWGSKEVA